MEAHEAAISDTTLSVVLQHPAAALEQRTVCSLLQVCRSWRAALQRLRAPVIDVQLVVPGAAIARDNVQQLAGLQQLAQMAAWVTMYPSLIRSISIQACNRSEDWAEDLPCTFLAVAEPHLAVSLKAASTAGTPFRLESYISNALHSSAVLAALPVQHLTRLEVHFGNNTQNSRSRSFNAAIARLTNLQSLQLTALYALPVSVLESLPQLRRLTYLRVCLEQSCDLQLLPVQLRQLHLEFTPRSVMDQPIVEGVTHPLSLSHLTALHKLELKSDADSVLQIEDGGSLPEQLKHLDLVCTLSNAFSPSMSLVKLFKVTTLHQLRSLALRADDEPLDTLQSLSMLSSLSRLDLIYTHQGNIAQTAPVWPQLSRLRCLHLDLDYYHIDPEILLNIAPCLGLATQLTSLLLNFELEFSLADDDENALVPSFSLLGHLSSLVLLQELTVRYEGNNTLDLEPRDALHISTLRNLKRLDISDVHSEGVVDNLVIATLAASLTLLTCLSVPYDTTTTTIG